MSKGWLKCSVSKFAFFQKISDQVFQLNRLPCHLFQCEFLVAGADMLWQVYCFIGFFQHGTGSLLRYRLHHTFILYTNISWDRTSRLLSLYANKVRRRTMIFFFLNQVGFLNLYTQNIIWYNTNYVLKNNFYLLLVQYISRYNAMVGTMQKNGQ